MRDEVLGSPVFELITQILMDLAEEEGVAQNF
jgi:hypothetical protein